jgi:uncharacterized membrane protein
MSRKPATVATLTTIAMFTSILGAVSALMGEWVWASLGFSITVILQSVSLVIIFTALGRMGWGHGR